MSPSFEQERDGSMREVPEMEVRSLETLSGTHKAGVIVHSSGELTITGTQQGSVSVQSGGRLVVHGNLQGSLHVIQGADVTVDGKLQGSVHVAPRGHISILTKGQCQGSIHNDGTIDNAGTRGGSVSGSGLLNDQPGSRVVQPSHDGFYYWTDWPRLAARGVRIA